MAYDKEKIFNQAKKLIETKKPVFIEELVSMLPISKQTFYVFFPLDSDEIDEIKDMLDLNKVEMKVSMRYKWFKSKAPALQLALMKLICTDDERKRLSMTHSEVKQTNINMEPITQEELDQINKQLDEDY